MALDFQRPDPSSPAAVASAQFTVTRRGYREEEVRDFLRQVSVEMARLLERERFLENELKALQARGPMDVTTIDASTITEMIGAEAARVLSAAREAAQAMRDRAGESAEQIVRDASREASRMLEESTLEASRRRSDVSSEAEQELELAKQQGREIVAEVRAYRERVLADIAKRTEEARRELERLVHERERLLTAFERARHAATDVVGDLTEFDEAIRGAGIVPPLVPPDAPPPPRPSRTSDTPIFDAKQYLDELGAQPRGEPPSDEAVAGEPDANDEAVAGEPASDAPVMSEPVTNEASTSDAVADDAAVQTPTTSTEMPTSAAEEKPAPSPSRGKATAEREERIAPVVSIFDRKRVSTPTSNDEREPIAKAPEHPVFERVEAQPEVESSTPAPSRVDEIFERLRSSSTQRVAQDTKKDLVKKETTPKAVRPRPVDPAVFRQRDEVVAGVLDAMKRSAKRLSADDENAVLTHVGTKRSVLSLEAMLPPSAEHAQRYADAMKEEVTAIAVNAARSLSESRRADLRKVVVDGAVLDAVTSFVASDLLHPLRERIAAALTQAANDRDVAMKSIRSAFAEWKAQHMESVVVDIAHLAYARGLFLGCESTSHVCWAVDPNGPDCADAEDNALAGRVRRGEKFPTGHEQPLAHAGCRCLVLPLDK
jgi:DivIVA domain-containing protein